MITGLSLTNFKSWKSIPAMQFGSITGLFGANSSGKTSILQHLLLLKQTADSPDRAQVFDLGRERSPVSLGTFRDILHYGRQVSPRRREFSIVKPGEAPAVEPRVAWELYWSLPREMKIPNPERPQTTLFLGRELAHSADIMENGSGRPIVGRMAYDFAGQRFGMSRDLKREGRYKVFSEAGDFAFRRTQGRPWELPPPAKCYGFPDQVRAYYQNAGFLADFELAFEQLFHEMYYLGPLREYPHRQYTWAGTQPADMGQRGEHVIDALLAARERGTMVSRGKGYKRFTVEEYVAWWLKKLGLIHSFKVEPITKGGNLYEVRLRKNPGSAEVLITDAGFGVSQILPVLTLCYYAPEGSTLILEQPEIHLHPSVQAGLADVFIDAIRARRVQIIVESHSEHLLLRLQRRIAEEQFSSDQAKLYFCEMSNGESRLVPLDLDLFGNIRNYPEAFFGDAFEETAAMVEAASRRKKRPAA